MIAKTHKGKGATITKTMIKELKEDNGGRLL